MSTSVVRIVLAEAVGILLLVVAIALVRRGFLAIRYGLGWVTIAVAIIVVAPFLHFLPDIARWLGLTPTGLTIGLVVVFLGLICLQLSISLSGLSAAIQNLSERSALLEQRVRAVEQVLENDAATIAPADPAGEPLPIEKE
jgi:Uncharacterized conserved protein (DUF2304)